MHEFEPRTSRFVPR